MLRKINKNFHVLRYAEMQGKRGAVMEGGSRSGKTWGGIDKIVYLASHADKPLTVNIIRETYNSFKTTLYDDFNRRLPMLNLVSPFATAKEIQSFFLFGTKINLIGADKLTTMHGVVCDYFWINEGLYVKKEIFDQQEMRCRRFWWMDYNPTTSDHYVYDSIIPRKDVAFIHSTLLDNPYISQQEKNKILSYEPTKENKERGTADDYNWKVYGLGLRASPEGLIFPDVIYIDQFPDNVERISYGMDFGYTNHPTTLVKAGKSGNNLYLEKKLYAPTENATILDTYLQTIPDFTKEDLFWCDSENPGMIADLQQRGYKAFGVKKFKGSIKYGIDLIKQHKVYIVRSHEFKKEQENYRWRVVDGKKLNEPVDRYNDLWDAARYAVLMSFRNI